MLVIFSEFCVVKLGKKEEEAAADATASWSPSFPPTVHRRENRRGDNSRSSLPPRREGEKRRTPWPQGVETIYFGRLDSEPLASVSGHSALYHPLSSK